MREIYRSSSQVIVWLGAHSLYEKTWEIIEELRPLDQSSLIDWGLIYHSFPELLSGTDNYVRTLCLGIQNIVSSRQGHPHHGYAAFPSVSLHRANQRGGHEESTGALGTPRHDWRTVMP